MNRSTFKPIMYILIGPIIIAYGILAGIFSLFDWLFSKDGDDDYSC